MLSKDIKLRLDEDLYEALEDEAKKRNQSVSALVRTFIRGGLLGYSILAREQVEANQMIEDRLHLLEIMAGASIHEIVEHKILQAKGNERKPNETAESHMERLLSYYRESVKGSVAKSQLVKEWIQEQIELSRS